MLIGSYGEWDLTNGCVLNEEKSQSWFASNSAHRCNAATAAEAPTVVPHARAMWVGFAQFLRCVPHLSTLMLRPLLCTLTTLTTVTISTTVTIVTISAVVTISTIVTTPTLR